MLNIAEQLRIRNARRRGLRPYRTRNNSGGSSAEETAAGQCRRLAGHGPVSITGRRPESRGLWLTLSGDNAQNPDQAALSLKIRAKERIDSIFSSDNPCRSSSLIRFFVQQSPQYTQESRTARVVFAITLFMACREAGFQVPSIGRLLDRTGHSRCFLNHVLKFLAHSSVESLAGDGLSDFDQISSLV